MVAPLLIELPEIMLTKRVWSRCWLTAFYATNPSDRRKCRRSGGMRGRSRDNLVQMVAILLWCSTVDY